MSKIPTLAELRAADSTGAEHVTEVECPRVTASQSGNVIQLVPAGAEPRETVGYGHAPEYGQFNKGRSGNPKGRPKGSRNLRTQLWEVYTQKITIRDGKNKKRSVAAIAAVHHVHMAKALKGDARSALIVHNYARELGVYDQPEPQVIKHEYGHSDEELMCLSRETLRELINVELKVVDELNAIRAPKEAA